MHTAFLIDGFNFYHSLKNFERRLRWFNYYEYCLHFMRSTDTLQSITYFTALAHWLPDGVRRHEVFIEACAAMGIRVVLGKFKEKTFRCPHCAKDIFRHEEKATDVNIALHAYRLAAQGIEQIFFVSGDTDLIPAARLIKQDFPDVKVGVIFPYQRSTREFTHIVDVHHKTSRQILERFILPERITKANGKVIICPDSWR